MLVQHSKKCCGCERILSAIEFCSNRSKKDGLNTRCKSCASVYNKLYYRKNAEGWNKKRRPYYSGYYQANRDRVRWQHIKKHYGLSEEAYQELLKKQKYCCRICREPFTDTKKTCVDHCHTGGHVRAILCGHCNRAIGLLKHNHQIALSAAEYLSRETLFTNHYASQT